ncbi:MAG: hypothetical protein Q4A81_00525 [Pasteurellaceae bacterium]|nr:hypothetical protein [Pasteurellaceae bacterium]
MKKLLFASVITLSVLPLSVMAKGNASVKVNYACEGNQNTSITYSFNKEGIPTKATTLIDGKMATLKYDLDKSDDSDTYFINKKGDMIGMNVLTRDNVRSADAVTVTNAKNQIVRKACSPQ